LQPSPPQPPEGGLNNENCCLVAEAYYEDQIWRIYPEIKAWKFKSEEYPENAKELIKAHENRYRAMFEVHNEFENHFKKWLKQAESGVIGAVDLSETLTDASEHKYGFPLTASQTAEAYKESSSRGRNILWSLLGYYRKNDKVGVVEHQKKLITIEPYAENPYETLSQIKAKSFLYRENGRGNCPFDDLLKYLASPLPEAYSRSEVYHEIVEELEPVLLSLIKEETKILFDIGLLIKLLNNPSLFIRKAAASVTLTLQRKGIDMSEMKDTLLSVFLEKSSSKGGLSGGTDIQPEENEPGTGFASMKPFDL